MRHHEQQISHDDPDLARSAPAPVPSGRTEAREAGRRETEGRTDVPDDALEDRGTIDDPAVAGGRNRNDPDEGRPDDLRDGDRRTDRDMTAADQDGQSEFHEPAPVPTAFGATTVGGAVAASALSSPRPEDEPDPRADWTVRPGDGAVNDRIDGVDDRRGGGTTRRGDADAAVEGAAGYGSPESPVIDPDRAATKVPSATIPPEPATLFEPGMAQSFRDRWHDVELRFVDDPREALGEAQHLVEEAIQALTAALATERNRLSGWQEAGSENTERLRMAVRQHRDFLDLVLGRWGPR